MEYNMTTAKKFLKNPSHIEAVQFDGTESSMYPGVTFRYDDIWFVYNESTDSWITIDVMKDPKEYTDNFWYIYNKLHDSWIKIKIGDYYRVDIEGDNYPIDQEYMKENYTEVEE